MQNSESIKTTFVKNLNKQIFSSTINIPIDNNVNIKTILNIDSYIFGEKIDCANGKAIVTGKIGIKVLYLDMDNMTNLITDNQTFSETIIDSSITADSVVVCASNTSNCHILSKENSLKLACEISVNPIMFVNVGVANTLSNMENLVTRKNELTTDCIAKVLNESFEYSTSFETKDNISKILTLNSYFNLQSAEAIKDICVIEGKLYQTLVYETNENDENVIKEMNDCFSVKYDLNVGELAENCSLDLCAMVDASRENISTSTENDNSVIEIVNTICVKGIATKSVAVEYVDDLYSVDNETETVCVERDFFAKAERVVINENLSGEITLEDNEPAIENIVSNMSVMSEVTNCYVKNDSIWLEGVFTSHLVYLDENKNYQQKQIELPFVFDTKIPATSLPCVNCYIGVLDCRAKAKRGTVIELNYTLQIHVSVYKQSSVTMVDNVTIGAPLNFSQYDFQIFLARPNETLWEVCKRTKTTPDELNKYNKDLPSIMQGKEKIIVKR